MSSLGVKTFPVIKPGTEQFNVWRQYFEVHLRWTPVIMRKLIDNAPDKPKEGMTVPADFPQHFDSSFVENKAWRAPAPKQLSKLSHQTIEELRVRFGPNWGIKTIAHEKKKAREYKPLTDDDLRKLYGPRHDEAAE